MAEQKSVITASKITTSVGMSVQLANGNWVKTGHTVDTECTKYPPKDMYQTIAAQQLEDATKACKEQIELLNGMTK